MLNVASEDTLDTRTIDATRKEKLDIPLVEEAKGQVQFFVLSVSGSPLVELCLGAKLLPRA